MTEPIKIDSHIHLYRRAEDGIAAKEGYEIWEYGAQAEVALSDLAGTVDELLGAMAEADIAKAVLVNLFIADEERRKYREAASATGAGGRQEAEIEARLREDFVRFNRWACQVARAHSAIVPFIGVDVNLFPGEESATQIRELAENDGARGVKLHGPAQGFHMGDERLWPAYAACQSLGLPIVGHSGPDRDGKGLAEPRAFGAVLAAFPDLPIVLAHMGGATWQQAREIAMSYPNAYFDCCEIIEWTRSDNGPSDDELARLIREIGPDRVMMGSDYPWYDLDHTVERVMDLPLLSAEEKEGILGSNALRILKL